MSAVVEPIARIMSTVGLNTPIQRFLAMAALGGAAEFMVRPPYSFESDGTVRPWAVISKSDRATYLPVGSTALLLGGIFGLFV